MGASADVRRLVVSLDNQTARSHTTFRRHGLHSLLIPAAAPPQSPPFGSSVTSQMTSWAWMEAGETV